MVNRREKEIANKYEDQGWVAVRCGAPDWLFVKTEEGEISDAKFVEVKSPSGQLRYEQSIWLRVLKMLGADADVEVVE